MIRQEYYPEWDREKHAVVYPVTLKGNVIVPAPASFKDLACTLLKFGTIVLWGLGVVAALSSDPGTEKTGYRFLNAAKTAAEIAGNVCNCQRPL